MHFVIDLNFSRMWSVYAYLLSYIEFHKIIRAPFRILMVIARIWFHIFKRKNSIAVFWNDRKVLKVFAWRIIFLLFFTFIYKHKTLLQSWKFSICVYWRFFTLWNVLNTNWRLFVCDLNFVGALPHKPMQKLSLNSIFC